MSVDFNKIAERVGIWNAIAGNETSDNKKLEEQIELYVNLCYEEAKEGYDALEFEGDSYTSGREKTNYNEILDSAVDQFVVLSRLINLLDKRGFDIQKGFNRILDNNDSKYIYGYEPACSKTPDDVLATLNNYGKKGVEARAEYNEVYNKWVIKNDLTNKILKPIHFQAVDLSDLVPEDLR